MRHFGLSLDFVRLYGGSLENLDYPIPGRVYSTKAGSRDSATDENLRQLSVHHLISLIKSSEKETLKYLKTYLK
jgi:hypothetical protein